MSRPREELHELLCNVLGSRFVYFQPPASVNLTYPCIVYNLGGYRPSYANNNEYLMFKQYTLTYIDKDPDSDVLDVIERLPYCRFDRPFIADNLNHYVFTIFY